MVRPRSPAARQLRRRLLVAGGLLAALLGLLLATCFWGGDEAPEELVVFAASSLAEAAEGAAEAFEATYPDVDVVVHVGASSTLARRIEGGAPADVFLSASPRWTDYLRAAGQLRGPARLLVRNRLAVVGPADAPGLDALPDLLRLERIALADPGRVPAGQYAKAGLERAGLWEELAPRVTSTADERGALAAVESGAADAAVVYATDLRGNGRVRELVAWPEALQPPIRYTVAIPRSAPHPDRALEFVEWLRQPERARLWRRYGFVPPAEPLTP